MSSNIIEKIANFSDSNVTVDTYGDTKKSDNSRKGFFKALALTAFVAMGAFAAPEEVDAASLSLSIGIPSISIHSSSRSYYQDNYRLEHYRHDAFKVTNLVIDRNDFIREFSFSGQPPTRQQCNSVSRMSLSEAERVASQAQHYERLSYVERDRYEGHLKGLIAFCHLIPKQEEAKNHRYNNNYRHDNYNRPKQHFNRNYRDSHSSNQNKTDTPNQKNFFSDPDFFDRLNGLDSAHSKNAAELAALEKSNPSKLTASSNQPVTFHINSENQLLTGHEANISLELTQSTLNNLNEMKANAVKLGVDSMVVESSDNGLKVGLDGVTFDDSEKQVYSSNIKISGNGNITAQAIGDDSLGRFENSNGSINISHLQKAYSHALDVGAGHVLIYENSDAHFTLEKPAIVNESGLFNPGDLPSELMLSEQINLGVLNKSSSPSASGIYATGMEQSFS